MLKLLVWVHKSSVVCQNSNNGREMIIDHVHLYTCWLQTRATRQRRWRRPHCHQFSVGGKNIPIIIIVSPHCPRWQFSGGEKSYCPQCHQFSAEKNNQIIIFTVFFHCPHWCQQFYGKSPNVHFLDLELIKLIYILVLDITKYTKEFGIHMIIPTLNSSALWSSPSSHLRFKTI